MTCLTRPINVTVYDLDGSETPGQRKEAPQRQVHHLPRISVAEPVFSAKSLLTLRLGVESSFCVLPAETRRERAENFKIRH
jgi:hypothetical protein